MYQEISPGPQIFQQLNALCNARWEFDHESQTFKHSELELDTLNETGLGSMNIEWCARTQGSNSEGYNAISKYGKTRRVNVEPSAIVDGICRFQRRRAISNHFNLGNKRLQ